MPSHIVEIQSGRSPSIKVVVMLDDMPDDGMVRYAAPTPVPRGASFSGSGMPFASASQAFDRTPNKGVARVGTDHTFEVVLEAPGAYYVGLGTVKVAPVLHIAYKAKGTLQTDQLPLGEGTPFRTTTYPASRSSASFYDHDHVLIRSQEEILYDSAYPSTDVEPPDFWGGKPAR
jgi:hypothetical protein